MEKHPTIHPVVYPVIAVALAIMAGFNSDLRSIVSSKTTDGAPGAADAAATLAGTDIGSADVRALQHAPARVEAAKVATSGAKQGEATSASSSGLAAAGTDAAPDTKSLETTSETKTAVLDESKPKPEATTARSQAPADPAKTEPAIAGASVSRTRADHAGVVAMTFAYGSAELTAEGRRALAELVARLGAEKPTAILLSGHTDAVGPSRKNRELSRLRLKEVAALVRADGFKGRIRTSVKGESEPYQVASAAELTTEARRQLDRRVEARFIN